MCVCVPIFLKKIKCQSWFFRSPIEYKQITFWESQNKFKKMKRLQQRQTVEIFCSLLLSRIAEIFFLSISILWYNIIIIIKNTFFYLAFFFLLIFSPVYCLLDFAHFVRNERADLRSFSRITTFCKKKTSKFKY